MSTEGNDLRRRGRRIFSALRRQEEDANPPSESAPATDTPDGTSTEEAPEARAEGWVSSPPGAPTGAPTTVDDPPAAVTTETPDASEHPEPDPEPASVTPLTISAPDPETAPVAPEKSPNHPAVAVPPRAEPVAAEDQPTPMATEPVVGYRPPSEDTPEPAAEAPTTTPAPPLAPAEGGRVGPATTRSGAMGPLPGSEERSQVVDQEVLGTDDGDEGPEPYDLPRVVAIANQKGGVGKTTTSVNLGASLAELDYRVLVVDLDPQGNATTGLGINARNLQSSVYDVIMSNAAVEDCVEPTSLRNLFVAPATIDLAGAEIELVPAFSRELKLRRALEEVRDEYDYVLIDCPPSLGLLTINGLAAADDVIVPIQCEYYALEGLSQLIRNVSLVRTNLNPKLDVRGIVLTMYDARTKLADQVEQEVREHFGRRVYQTVVPRTVRLSEAPSFGQPIIVFDSTSRGAVAYRELAKEVSSGATRRSG
jgi:chromosome partitioning protein